MELILISEEIPDPQTTPSSIAAKHSTESIRHSKKKGLYPIQFQS